MKRKIILALVLVVIVGAVVLLEQTRNTSNSAINKQELALQSDVERIQQKEGKYPKAIELVSPDGYLNTDNITLVEHIGEKVILLDFWTYSCINCQRTLPYLTSWYDKYKDDGLLIVGIHTPEFEFEKDYDNVKKAVEKYGIEYPVVQDNNYQTWRAYGNRYWPRKYLIDIDGFIVYDHIGEGAYEETETKIQELLEERNQVLNTSEEIDKDIVNPDAENPDFRRIGTPEIYFGYDFSRNQLGNEKGWKPDEAVDYSLPQNTERNMFYLQGTWFNHPDYMELKSERGEVKLQYFAKNVNLVAGSQDPVTVEIYLDGEHHKNITVKDHDLYPVIQSSEYDLHDLELIPEKGARFYTFTFG